ncbi:MAG TPA: 3-deoxy-8-phosphooctulonate synthase, partial [Crocinitomix sp.]|nr:3-deoxy-8-phosphooctulonate synthase [Crocinitomix sp.]
KDMFYPAQKVKEAGNSKIMLTERGTLLGLGRLVVDFTQIVDMKEFGYPVVMDATHSTQRPGGGATSGGNPHYAPYIAKAAAAVGVDGYFMEVHPDPSCALSDGSNMLRLDGFREILKGLS